MEALKTGWDFFQKEILGMGWLSRFISTLLNACGFDTTGRVGGSIQFYSLKYLSLFFSLFSISS